MNLRPLSYEPGRKDQRARDSVRRHPQEAWCPTTDCDSLVTTASASLGPPEAVRGRTEIYGDHSPCPHNRRSKGLSNFPDAEAARRGAVRRADHHPGLRSHRRACDRGPPDASLTELPQALPLPRLRAMTHKQPTSVITGPRRRTSHVRCLVASIRIAQPCRLVCLGPRTSCPSGCPSPEAHNRRSEGMPG